MVFRRRNPLSLNEGGFIIGAGRVTVQKNPRVFLSFSIKVSYIVFTTVEQIIDIPVDRRITLEIPQTIPIGKTLLSFTPVKNTSALSIEDVRQLLYTEIAEKGMIIYGG